ncbi:kinase-like protein, partial [Fistulina hepatica ATCC 64428]
NWLIDERVAVKIVMPATSAAILQYEAWIYQQLAGSRAIPILHWSGSYGGADILVMDYLGPTLCSWSAFRSNFGDLRTSQLDFIEFAHSRGINLGDIKPHNFAVGHAPKPEKPSTVYAFDFGLAKMYVDPLKRAHIPLRTGRMICGTIRYSSHWSHLGLD